MANRKRIPFRASGPFIMRKAQPIGGQTFAPGSLVMRADLPPIADRKLEALFEANWIDMAPEGAEPTPPTEDSNVAVAPAAEPPVAAVERDEGASGVVAPEGGDAAPVEAPAGEAETGAAGASGGAPADTAGEEPEVITDTKLAAYKSFGFGNYYAINAANQKLDPDKHYKKPEAEGLAARDRVPLLGQNQFLGG